MYTGLEPLLAVQAGLITDVRRTTFTVLFDESAPDRAPFLFYLACSFALAAVVVASRFLLGTYHVDNELGQSFCLGAFSN